MKKFVKILAIVLGSIAFIVVLFFLLGWKMVGSIQAACNEIQPLQLENVADGIYRGQAGEFIVSVGLSVIVKDHRITEIDVDNQFCSSSHKARDTIGRIIDSQSAFVDATAGATWSSKSIMAATYDALKEQ